MPTLNSRTIIISLEKKTLSPEEHQILAHKNIGGLILFTRNFENKKQITELVAEIKKINPNIIVMVDHEGGRVWRFKNEEFPNPGHMQELETLYNSNPSIALAKAYDYGYKIASDLLECGIDLNLAPVVDLNHNNVSSVIGDRAFHSDPTIVARLTAKFIEGQQAAGMQAVGKHFPGHGAIQADSHLTTAIDHRSKEEIFSQDLEPFRLLIQGDDSLQIAQTTLPAIMPAHVIYPEIDDKPAGCSKVWLQNILREKLKFNGAIISDCLSMKAAQEFVNKPDKQQEMLSLMTKLNATEQQVINLMITKEALIAGCDLVIFNGVYKEDLKNLLDNLDDLNLTISEEQSQQRTIRIDNLMGNPKRLFKRPLPDQTKIEESLSEQAPKRTKLTLS